MRQQGLSLLEVMVALLVVSLALAGAVRAVGSFGVNQHHLESRVLAQWVADNRLVEARLGLLPEAAGETGGEDTMGGKQWRWRVWREPGGLPGLQQVAVEVMPAERPDWVAYRARGLQLRPPE